MSLPKLISDTTEKLLQHQLGIEYQAATTYLAMSNICDVLGIFGCKKYFLAQSVEEMSHYQKVADFLLDRNAVPQVPQILAVDPTQWTDLRTILYAYYNHEILVENSWKKVAQVVRIQEKDDLVYTFSQEFLKEQLQEVSTVIDLISTFETLSLGGNIGYATGRLDEIMGK